MKLARELAGNGNLHGARDRLKEAQEIDDNAKVRKRLARIEEAIMQESDSEDSTDQQNSSDFMVHKNRAIIRFTYIFRNSTVGLKLTKPSMTNSIRIRWRASFGCGREFICLNTMGFETKLEACYPMTWVSEKQFKVLFCFADFDCILF